MKLTIEDEQLGKLIIEKEITDFDDSRDMVRTILSHLSWQPCQIEDMFLQWAEDIGEKE